MHDGRVTLRYPDGSDKGLEAFIDASPPGCTIELAPGRYEGPIRIRKPVCLRGAGDLTRIHGSGSGRVIEVNVAPDAQVELESVMLEGGDAVSGAGLWLGGGQLRVHNLHIQRCSATGGGGGAIWVQGEGALRVRDAQIFASEARQGGALAIEGSAQVSLESVTVKKARATTPGGGQALFVIGQAGQRPRLTLRRVRLEDAPLGLPLFVDPDHPGDVSLTGCDMPRMVASVVGVVDGGENRWR